MNTIQLSQQVFVSDPCYTVGTWCQLLLKNVLPGTYHCNVNQDNIYSRNATLEITHQDYTRGKASNLPYDFVTDIGVDSGQAGIFSASSYRNDQYEVPVIPGDQWTLGNLIQKDEPGEHWYDKMCGYTCNTEEGWAAYDAGVVCSSGFGDGYYPVYAAKNADQQVISLIIEFMGEEKPQGDEYQE